ncbi:hypothetical protein CANMA_003323 [Candida margitis]|uniref:uncharacterized protein n=1 Tax=Candida margitis TaxID=1775924 RepID=UPI0022276484|nr:uncharacterized protein CANMA_003323 [Candida margitis]KAI5966077.1 hypothetical protein CANMA_003323 [Candida margitis]
MVHPYDGNVIHSFADTDDALNYAEHLYLNGDDVSKYRAFCNDTRMSLEGFDISREGKAKRWKCSNAPLGTHFTQRRTVENGTFFSKWSQVACEFNNSIQEVPHRALPKPWKYTKSKRADRGFNHKSCKRLAKSFGLDAVDKVKFNNDKEGVSCASKLNEFASASIRVPMFYSKQQTQRCVRKYYGKHGCKCGHWSKIKYGEFPIKNKRPEYLCSSQKNSCK